MCGIIGYSGSQDAVSILVEGLRKLEYRGYDSSGIAIQSSASASTIDILRSEGKLARLEALLESSKISGSCGLGHTRWATHGAPSQQNAHPHRTGKVCVVHNGIIENYRSLREQLQGEGREFTSQTDTEVIAHLLDRESAKEANFHLALRRVLESLEGAWAIAAMHCDHPNKIVVARNALPLLVGLPSAPSDSNVSPSSFVASDVSAILSHTRIVIDLEDGDTAVVMQEGIVEHFDAQGKSIQRKRRQIDWSPVAAEKQGFKHYMLKEIFEQPRCVRDTLIGRIGRIGRVDSNGQSKKNERDTKLQDEGEYEVRLDGFDLEIGKHARICLLACGTSWHAALVGKYLIEQCAKVPCTVELASEFRYREPVVHRGDIAIAVSQSGETADTLAAMREAKQRGATTVAICNVVDSTLARAADKVIYTHAGPEISVASTKAFTTQLTMFSMLAVWMGRQNGTLSDSRAQSIVEGLRELPVAMETILGQQAAVKTIARRYHSARDFLFLGRGLCFPVALEGALKLKEISYVHAEGYAAGEMKHGPIALIDESMPVVVLALKGQGYEKSLANLEEVRSRGGRVIAIASMGDEVIGDMVEDVLLIPTVDAYLQPILASVPLQLLAYFIADLKGTDVDQPRNLAKSVTVE